MPFNPAQVRDGDIEALVYCLLFLVQGTLPWEVRAYLPWEVRAYHVEVRGWAQSTKGYSKYPTSLDPEHVLAFTLCKRAAQGEFELVTIRELKESSLLGFVVDKTPEQELRHELYIRELQAAYRAMSPQSSLTQPFDWELMGITWSANGTVFASDGTVIHAISKHVPTRPDAALWAVKARDIELVGYMV
eukprot:5919531-Pleurochrysis_carterae.AAC.4